MVEVLFRLVYIALQAEDMQLLRKSSGACARSACIDQLRDPLAHTLTNDITIAMNKF